MKKIILIILTGILISLVLTACSGHQVDLYFALEKEGNFYLQKQSAQIRSSSDIYQATLEKLIEGPQGSDLFATIPASTKVNQVKVQEGLAIVDFSADILTDNSIPHSSTTETLAIYSIVNTLTQFESIDKVKITVEGSASGTIDGQSIEDFWGHIGLGQDFSRNEDIILNDRS